MKVALTRAVEFDEEHGLPRAEDELAAGHWNRERGAENGRGHMRPRMRGIMAVSKIDLWNHLLNHIQQIIFRPLSHLTGRQTGRRVGHEQAAETFRHPPFPDQRIHAIGQIDDLLQAISLYLQALHSSIITVRHARSAQLMSCL
jgi:hypothetical protein